MSTSPASFSTSNKYQDLISQWNNSMKEQTMSFEPFTRIHTADAPSIRRWSDLPIGRMPDWNGSAAIAAQAVGATNVNTYSTQGKALKVELLAFDVKHNPNLVQDKMMELQNSIIKTANALVFGTLQGAFSATYDDGAGGTPTVIGSLNKYASAGDADGVLDQDQSNSLTAGLSYDGLASAIQLMQRFRDASGEPFGMGTGPLVLIVPTELFQVATNLAGSAGLIVSGSMTAAAAATKIGDANPYASQGLQVVSSPLLSDTNNWFLCEPSAGGHTPVNFWTSGLPTINVTVDEANLKTVITAGAYMQSWVDGPASGLVGSEVAGA